MLRYCNQRTHSALSPRTRHYQSASPAASPEDSQLPTLRLRVREATQQTDAGPLGELRQSSLYRECYEWGRRQSQMALRDTAPENRHRSARNAATVHTICYALDALVDFSRHYDAQPTPSESVTGQQLESLFLKQIRGAHRQHLLAHFHASFCANSSERQVAVLSALDRQLVDKLDADGVISASGIRQEVHGFRQRADPAPAMNEAELLALVDYLNSGTGTFNAVNGAAMASAYYGEHAMHARVGIFSVALNSAISKLCAHPFFARRDIVCYKGIRLNGLDSPFRLSVLSEACAKGGLVAFPNVLSASSDPEHSYARKKFADGYTLECRIMMRRGFDADPFHDVDTMGEQEILGPANQRFRVTGKSTVSVFDWSGEKPQEVDLDQYALMPADL